MHKQIGWALTVSATLASATLVREEPARADAPGLTLIGSAPLPGVTVDELVVNPNGNRIYAAGNFPTGLWQIDATDPNAPVITLIDSEDGAGVAVNPATGRIAATLSSGNNSGARFDVFNPDFSLYDTQVPTGCFGSIVNGGSAFGIDMDCQNVFYVYDENAKAFVFSGPVEAERSVFTTDVLFNAATSSYYINHGDSVVVSPSFATSQIANVVALAANPVTNRVYVRTDNGPRLSGNVEVLDGSNNSVLATIAESPNLMAVNTVANHFYMVVAGEAGIGVWDGATNTKIGSGISPPGSFVSRWAMAAGDTRLYVIGGNPGLDSLQTLFVYQDTAAPVPATPPPVGLALAATLAALGSAWARSKKRTCA